MRRDESTQNVFNYLLQEASAPFFNLLGLWVCQGRIEDPYDEFFIEEHILESHKDALEVYDKTYVPLPCTEQMPLPSRYLLFLVNCYVVNDVLSHLCHTHQLSIHDQVLAAQIYNT
eukprot:SAG31_NODE_3383_length_4335_cov_2.093012_2_plen_116_part_00